MKRQKRQILIAILLPVFAGVLLAACSAGGTDRAVPGTGKIGVEEDSQYGNVNAEIGIDEFNALGFCCGDSVDVRFSNGYMLEDIPYYTGYFNPAKEPLVVAYPGNENIVVAINFGSLWEEAGLSGGDTAEISLASPGKYSEIQNLMSTGYKDEREVYKSDGVFANFRSVNTGSLRKNILFRSASPCDNMHNRAPYTDKLAAAAGIKTIVDIADDSEEIEGFIGSEDFDSPYFYSLYEKGAVIPVNLAVNYTSDDYKTKTAGAFRTMASSEGPFLIHCLEGKDRTGFVLILLEALTGASYDEMEADYMLSYSNYYGIDRQSDPEAYEMILNNNFVPMLRYITGAGKDEDITAADFGAGAVSYLIECGLSEEEIRALEERLTDSTPPKP